MTPEEERALEWQLAQQRRKAFKRSFQALLKAPAEPLHNLLQKFDPLRRHSSGR